MNQITDTASFAILAGEAGFDPIEEQLRTNVSATIENEAGKVTEWRSKTLPLYRRLTKKAEALIAASTSTAPTCDASSGRCSGCSRGL